MARGKRGCDGVMLVAVSFTDSQRAWCWGLRYALISDVVLIVFNSVAAAEDVRVRVAVQV